MLSETEDATSLALMRIVAGVTVTGHVVHTWWSGAAAWVWLDDEHGGLRNLTGAWLASVGGATPANVTAAMIVAIGAGIATTLGLYTRLAAALCWASWRVLADLNGHAGGSNDELMVAVLWLVLISGSGRALSLDAAWRGLRGPVARWPRWLGVLQLAVMYEATAVQKVSAGWVPGGPLDALWYILQQPTWHRAPMEWMAPAFVVTQVATLGTWLFEHAAPLFLLAFWFRRTRTHGGWLRAQFNRIDFRGRYLLVGVAMHLGIEASMEVGPFLGATMALYCCALAPEEWSALRRRYRPSPRPR
jgi:hypothetical protein